MFKVVLIAAGGGLGAVLRYAVAGWSQGLSTAAFPIGTLVVNTLACLAVGFLGTALSGPLLIREEYRVALLVGLLGGFSTFSTYGLETFSLLSDGQKWRAGANVLLSHGLGLGAVWIGYRLAGRLCGS